MKNIKVDPLIVFSFSLYCFLVLVRALSMDMFFDGVIYASIAQNLALGKGSFWHLYYTEQFLNPFYEHPPLAMWMQSIAFKVFGPSWRVELVWGFVCGLLTLLYIKKIYEQFSPKKASWWPIVLFISIPTVTWTFANNLLENTLIAFSTATVYYSIKALKADLKIHSYLYSALCGVLIFMGLMIKGLPALFPLAIPFIWILVYWGKEERTKNAIACFSRMILYLFFALILFNVFSNGELYRFFTTYFNEQVVKSIKGQREDIKHFYLLYRFIGEIIVPVAITAVIYAVLKFKKIRLQKDPEQIKTALLFLLIALSASLPMFFIPKQRIWYLFPSFVFYVMAIAKFSEHKISVIKPYKFFTYFGVLLLIAGLLCVTVFGGTKFKRNNEFYKDVIAQKELLPIRSILYTCPEELSQSWELTAFLQRFCLSSMTDKKELSTGFVMVDRNNKSDCAIPKKMTLINKDPVRYELYR